MWLKGIDQYSSKLMVNEIPGEKKKLEVFIYSSYPQVFKNDTWCCEGLNYVKENIPV